LIVNNASAAWGGERGLLTSDLIIGIGQPKEDGLVYIAGPEPMVEKLNKDLIHAGLDKQQLVSDFFANYSSTY
jgi:NAD(P)H-flavin reductase